MRRVRTARRAAFAAGTAWLGFVVLIDAWRTGEAAVVASLLGAAGVRGIERVGGQIIVDPSGGGMFLATVDTWCSSLAIVLFFAMVAATACVEPRRRWRAFAWGAAIVVVCNLMRIAATVIVGVRRGAGAIEPFHDGPATAFAVLFVLGALAAFVGVLWQRPAPTAGEENSSRFAQDRGSVTDTDGGPQPACPQQTQARVERIEVNR